MLRGNWPLVFGILLSWQARACSFLFILFCLSFFLLLNLLFAQLFCLKKTDNNVYLFAQLLLETRPALGLGYLGHGLRAPNMERPPNMGAVIFFIFFYLFFFFVEKQEKCKLSIY